MTKLQQYCQKSRVFSLEHKLFKDHLQQNLNSMKYSRILQYRLHNYEEKQINLKLNPEKLNKKTVIFDLDETLIHCDQICYSHDYQLTIPFCNGESQKIGVNIRPHAISCLKELTKHFEIIIFTASNSQYAQQIISLLDPERTIIDHVLYREYCLTTPEGFHIKDLRIFSNRKLENLCLIDNSSYSFALQISNGVPIIPFFNNKRDNELVELIPYVMQFVEGDIQSINRKTFQLEKYVGVEEPSEVLKQFL